MTRSLYSVVVASIVFAAVRQPSAPLSHTGVGAPSSCFLLFEIGVGETVRQPSDICQTRLTPASTFKVPHALAALDAQVVSGPDEEIAWDGTGEWPLSSRRTHTLASAIRNSVVWYFQTLATRLGSSRETDYLRRFAYGNMDVSSGLTTFWIRGSLQISPEEEERFLVRLFTDSLPISKRAMSQVREMMRQPDGVVVNAVGEHPFAAPWPPGTTVRAKPGSAPDKSGRQVRWLVGEVERGTKRYIFVACVAGEPKGDVAPNAAIDLAALRLHEEGIL